ncbi:MAG: TGS domain-containing protein, partial [Alphaproteobacteria bacterium]|nr:TGS domain-containing protein [Alphaproteobacteria bacterium]
MISIEFPDGQRREYAKGVNGLDIAESISKSLAKKTVALTVNGDLYDLTRPIHQDAAIHLIMKDSPEGLDVIRHDAAHVFAEAVKELYPDTQITIGPSIDSGFYYDLLPTKLLTPDDLPKIEKRMRDIVARNETITREEWDRDEAIAFFKGLGEHFKAEIISDLPSDQTISLYRQGDFIDLCRGPHMPSTGHLGTAFKLLSLAGAYWRGDSKNQMLQRVYGTAFATQAELDQYLFQIEEAKKRDHRKLGVELELFHLQEEAVGAVFWHPKGWTFYRALENFIRKKLEHAGYVEVKTPQLLDRSLWEASGHWEKFRDAMFTVEADEDKTLCVKPMNCPCHVQIFKQGLKSYRDLPLRMAEFGSCHRN